MKFRTADLIARVDDAIEARKEAAKTASAEWAKAESDRKAEWLALHGAEISNFCTRAKDKIRKGRVITRDDLPVKKNGWGEFPVYGDPRHEPKPAFVDDLLRLRATLTAVEDEFVTTTGLREIGFKDLSRMFRVSA